MKKMTETTAANKAAKATKTAKATKASKKAKNTPTTQADEVPAVEPVEVPAVEVPNIETIQAQAAEIIEAQSVEVIEKQSEPKTPSNRELQFIKLIEISEQARKIKEEILSAKEDPIYIAFFQNLSLNFFILNFVYQGIAKEFNTYDDWQEIGAQVNKGEKSYLIWGTPEIKAQPDGTEKVYYPIKHVFSNDQVTFKAA